jgi:hypothetical protein
MRRRCTSVVFYVLLALGAVAVPAGAQDLRPLGTDLSTLLGGIGDSLLPSLQQTAVADNGIGAASMGTSHFYFGFDTGVTFGTPALLAVLTESPSPFELIDVSGLLGNLSESSAISSYLKSVENLSYFPYPDLELTAGFAPIGGVQVLAKFSILPEALTDLVTGIAGLKDSGITLNELSANVRVRKTLLEDQGAFPAVSVGIGYAYTNVQAGLVLPTQKQPFAGYNLTFGGTLNMEATMSSVGADLSISKRLLIFTPYLSIAPWYQWASFSGSMDPFNFSLKDSGGADVAGASRTSRSSSPEAWRSTSADSRWCRRAPTTSGPATSAAICLLAFSSRFRAMR